MDISAILVIVVLLLSSANIVKFFARRAKLHRLIDKIPGPPAYPIIGTTYLYIGVKPTGILNIFRELIKKYGPLYRTWLGPIPEVTILKPQYFETVINGMKHLNKSTNYRFFRPWLGDGLITNSGPTWHAHRKIITPAFHLNILDSFLEVISEKCDILMENLEKNADKGGFDIHHYITLCALDIICETAMGVQINAQNDEDSVYVKANSDIGEMVTCRRRTVWLHPDFIFYNTPTGRRFKKCLDIVHGFTRKVIQERKAALTNTTKSSYESSDEDRSLGIRKKKAFLDLLLEVSKQEDKMTDEELREEVDTFMFAGHDTTASSISWVIFMLGLHPEIQEKVYAELTHIFKGSKRSPTMKDLHEMKYLDQVIKETMRLYPSVPFIQRLLSEDINIGGYEIPAGTIISIFIYFVHRNPEFFPNPEVFDPDNFLPERIQNRHPFAFIPFSAGPRNCIGQKFALMEEKTLVSSILRKFKIHSLEKREDVKDIPAIVLRPENGIKVSLTSRE